MDISVEDDWEAFLNDGELDNNTILSADDSLENHKILEAPKCSDIYISTQTKIAYLNQTIDLDGIFWELPMVDYCHPKEGIIKKQMKMNSFTQEKVDEIQHKIDNNDNARQKIISFIEPKKNQKKVFKHVQKVTVGYSKKDFTNFRSKEKGAFYNCFALILRVKVDNAFKEVHVKVFNTGKLEIPGIKESSILTQTFSLLVNELQPFIDSPLIVVRDSVDTVLINSNFTCNYYIERSKLHQILKKKYNMISMFDPCSYPGIQCRFFYNKDKEVQDGVCRCSTKCNKKGSGNGDGQCIEISFMIFRTGSVLIVGHCDENILHIIYRFIKNILETEFHEINNGLVDPSNKKDKVKKIRTKKIIVS